MSVRRHQIPDEIFTSLADGGGGCAAVRHLVAVEYSKHMLLVRGVVEASRESGHPQHGLARRGYALLSEIQVQAADTVDEILRYPSVGAWAGQTVLALRRGEPQSGAGPAGLAALAASAAIKSRFPCAIEVPAIADMIMFPALGQLVIPGLASCHHKPLARSTSEGAEVLIGNRRFVIPGNPHADAPGWQGLRLLTAESAGEIVRLLIDDLDPYRMPAPSLGTRLTAEEVRKWQSDLNGAWDVLVQHHRNTAEEIRAAIRVLTPLEAPPHGQVSATSRETFGCIALSTPAGPLALAVTLAHEIQHAKLSALLDIMKLTHPDDGSLFYAPWREDPRPASGLLQGAYAYLGVAEFWRRQRQEEKGNYAIRAHAEFARWRSAVSVVARTLTNSGRLTRTGEIFVARMARVARTWLDDPVPAEAMRIARREAEQHAQRLRFPS